MVFSYILDPLLLNEVCIILQHFCYVFFFAMLFMCIELYSCQADQLGGPNMPRKYAIYPEQSLAPDLIIICIVDWDACVALPNKEGLGDFLARLATHRILPTFCI